MAIPEILRWGSEAKRETDSDFAAVHALLTIVDQEE
jgi:hypothetical protein